MTTAPRIRSELRATAAEEDGVKFFDVSDPKSGATMRLYDFEWLIAAQLNGTRGVDEVAHWAPAAIGVEPTVEAINELVAQLRPLGFFEVESAFGAESDRTVKYQAPPVFEPTTQFAPEPGQPSVQLTALHGGTFQEDEATRRVSNVAEVLANKAAPEFAEAQPTVRRTVGELEMGEEAKTRQVVPSAANLEMGEEAKTRQVTPSAANLEMGEEAKTRQVVAPTVIEPEIEAESSPSLAALVPDSREQPAAAEPLAVDIDVQAPVSAPAAEPAPVAARAPAARPTAAPVATPSKAPVRAPVAPPEQEEEEEAPRRSSALSIAAVILVLVGVGAGVAYVALGPMWPVDVAVQVAARRDIVRLHDGKTAVKPAPTEDLSFPEAGKISDITAAGTQTRSGMPLAKLEALGKVEKDLVDVRDRAAFYQKQLDQTTNKTGDAFKKLEAKVAEKRKLLEELEGRAARLRLTAPRDGTVKEVLASTGAEVKAGAPVVRFGSPAKAAEFSLPPAKAAALKVGDAVSVQRASGGTLLPSKVTAIDAEKGLVSVEIEDKDGLKDDEEVRLVQSTLSKVVAIPSTAMTAQGDAVYVASGGKAVLRKIKIADRGPKEVFVSEGVSDGDSVITTGVETLREGQRVTPH